MCAVLGTVDRLSALQAAAADGAVAAKQQSWQQARRNQECLGGAEGAFRDGLQGHCSRA